MKSATQIWKEAQPGVSFAQWIDGEKSLYQSKIENGKIQGKMDFDNWLNARHAGKLNATGTFGSSAKEILLQTAEKLKTASTVSNQTTQPVTSTKKTILGMKPIVFYSLTATVVIIAGALIYKKMKKS